VSAFGRFGVRAWELGSETANGRNGEWAMGQKGRVGCRVLSAGVQKPTVWGLALGSSEKPGARRGLGVCDSVGLEEGLGLREPMGSMRLIGLMRLTHELQAIATPSAGPGPTPARTSQPLLTPGFWLLAPRTSLSESGKLPPQHRNGASLQHSAFTLNG
jgi:hypothetical protein